MSEVYAHPTIVQCPTCNVSARVGCYTVDLSRPARKPHAARVKAARDLGPITHPTTGKS